MKWAFWRRESTAPAGVGSRATSTRARGADDDSPRSDPAAELRVRARRRLIGAAALLLAAVVLVPMVLDPAPRPVPDTVPIDIPSEKTPFTPRLALPPVPEPGSAPMPPPDVAPAPDSKGEVGETKTDARAEPRAAADDKKAGAKAEAKSEPKADAKTEVKAEAKTDTKSDTKADTKAAAEAQRARDILEGKAAADKKGRFGVQAAALSSEGAANELAARLKKAGLAPYTERVQTQDGPRWRVRLGPYATREEAERVRARLRALDVNASLVGG